MYPIKNKNIFTLAITWVWLTWLRKTDAYTWCGVAIFYEIHVFCVLNIYICWDFSSLFFIKITAKVFHFCIGRYGEKAFQKMSKILYIIWHIKGFVATLVQWVRWESRLLEDFTKKSNFLLFLNTCFRAYQPYFSEKWQKNLGVSI